MASSPSKSPYKWWETDDKTKRLYTELLAEKIAKSPKKSPSKLTRSASSCSDLRSRLEALESKGMPPSSPGKKAISKISLTSSDESSSVPHSPRRYTFETVTMDTLAKYEYIKSPKKKPLGSKDSSSSSPSLSSLSSTSLSSSPAPSSGSDEEYDKKCLAWKTHEVNRPSSSSSREDESPRNDVKPWMFRGNDKNAREQEQWKFPTKTTPTKGGQPSKPTSKETDKWKPNPMLMLMTSSSKPELKSIVGKTKNDATGSPTLSTRKERVSRFSSKLDEVPEYSSTSSGDNMEDTSDSGCSGRKLGRTFIRNKSNCVGAQSPTKSSPQSTSSVVRSVDIKSQPNNTKANDTQSQSNKNSSPHHHHQVSTKIEDQDSSEEELDINQISQKFQALCEEVEQLEFKMFQFSNDVRKLKISIGIKDEEGTDQELQSPKHHYNHAFTLAAGKDLLADRVTTRALLMRQYSSPTKSPRNIAKLLKNTGLDKEMAEADACKTKALEKELRKVNEKDLTDEEIQDVLRNAKARYVENSNFLENTGFGATPRKKG